MLAVVMLNSCINDDPENKLSGKSVINTRAINGDQVVFSQGSTTVEMDYSNMTIKFTADYKDSDGISHTFTTPEMKMSAESNSVYSFKNTAASTGIDNFNGHIDRATNMISYNFNDGSTLVVSTSHLYYAYASTSMSNPDNGNSGSHKQSAYLFALDAKGESCIMQIDNFITNMNGSVDVPQIQYRGLHVVPTTTGYKITAEKAESNYEGFYAITDLDITLSDQCNTINGTFTCNDIKFAISGKLFPNE